MNEKHRQERQLSKEELERAKEEIQRLLHELETAREAAKLYEKERGQFHSHAVSSPRALD
jgi:hypothetical protein